MDGTCCFWRCEISLLNRSIRLKVYVILLLFGIITFISSLVASGIVGSYIIDENNIEEYLVFTEKPIDKTDISDIDKFLYAFDISVYPYITVISVLFILIITFLFIKTKKSMKTIAK